MLNTLDQTMKDAPTYLVKSNSLNLAGEGEKIPFITLDNVQYLNIRPLQNYITNQPFTTTYQFPGKESASINRTNGYVTGTDIFTNTSDWFTGVIFTNIAKLSITATVNPDGTLWIEI